MLNQTNAKHFINPEDIFKSGKHFLEKRKPKEESLKTTLPKVLNKTSNRKKTSKQQYNFCTRLRFLLEVHGM